jgi:Helix-turn-helix domain
MDSPLLTVNEAADYVRGSASYLNKLRVTGGGPQYIKRGSRVFYRRADLDRWLDKQVRKSTAEGKAA